MSQIRHISGFFGFSSLALSYFSFCFEQKQYLKFNSFLTLKLFFLILQHYIFKKLPSINTSIVHIFSSFFFLVLFVAIWLFMKIVIIRHKWWKFFPLKLSFNGRKQQLFFRSFVVISLRHGLKRKQQLPSRNRNAMNNSKNLKSTSK